MAQTGLESRLAEQQHGDHLCVVYEDRDEQMKVAIPFIKQGLARGECCAYIADDQTVEEVIAALAEAGVDVEREQARGALLLLTKRDAYLRSGSFDPHEMIEFLGETVDECLRKGFTGFRVTGEMTWALGDEIGCDRLIEYESLLNEFFPGRPVVALCQYNRRRFPPAIIHDVLRTHPLAVLGDQVCSNLYYEPPQLILEGGHEAERVEWMIQQLKRSEQEIAERRRAEAALRQSEEFTRRIIESSQDCIKVLDLDGRLLSMSAGGQRLMEIENLNARLRHHWVDFWGGTDHQAARRAIHEAREGGIGSFEGFCPTMKGTPKWWHVLITPIRDSRGKPERLLAISRDITERKLAEQERLEADRAKDEFLATLAHELRNPLAPIRTGLELLRLAGSDPQVLEETRSTMERQVQQLVRLVDDLLDVSRITRGKLELRTCRVELASVVRGAVEASRAQMTESGHTLEVDLPSESVYLTADPHRLTQVFCNLLDNAAKYTRQGGRIQLAVERQGREVVVVVRDSGIGIPNEMLDRIFDMFTQVNRSFERASSGLGIGLTLVKRLVEMHGGRVEARSEGTDRGSEFRVRLPIRVEQPANLTGPGNKRMQTEGTRRRILVVDDNRDAAQLLGMMLGAFGNEVHLAYDGIEAVEAAESLQPELVLMDLGMPRMNGYEAARKIRTHSWGSEMMLVALTGWGQEEDKRRTREAGFDHHLVKPVEPAELQALLAGLRSRTEHAAGR